MAEENQGTQVSNPQENSKPRTNNRRPHNNNRKPNDNANAKTGEQAGGASQITIKTETKATVLTAIVTIIKIVTVVNQHQLMKT